MTIMIAGDKGGTGKSPLSYIIATYFGYDIFTNEATVNEQYYDKVKKFIPEHRVIDIDGKKKKVKIPEDMPISKNTVYDFAGEINAVTIEIAREADVIIVPTTDETDSVVKSANAMLHFARVATKKDCSFILVATRIAESKSKKEIGYIQRAFESTVVKRISRFEKEAAESKVSDESIEKLKNLKMKFFKIRENKMFRYLRDNRMSFRDLEMMPKLQLSVWENTITETKKVIEFIEDKKQKMEVNNGNV